MNQTPGPARSRHHLLSTAVVALASAVALVVVLATAGPRTTGPALPQPSPSQTAAQLAEQDVLLVQVTEGRDSVASLLVTQTPQHPELTMVQVPRQAVVADGPALTTVTDAAVSLDEGLALRSMSTAVGVGLDIGWRLDRKALAALVDAVDGLTVEVPRNMRLRDLDGDVVLRLTEGRRRLTGSAAAWYVCGWIRGEAGSGGQEDRFVQVFKGVLRRLPQDSAAINQVLVSLGALSSPTVNNPVLAAALAGWGPLVEQEPVRVWSLPLARRAPASVVAFAPAPAGTPVGSPLRDVPVWMDQRAAVARIRTTFAHARRPDADGPRVVAWYSTTQPEQLPAAMRLLSDQGFAPIPAGRHAPAGAWAQTTVLGRGADSSGTPWAELVAQALGLPDAVVGVDDSASAATDSKSDATSDPRMPPPGEVPVGDVDVILGADFPGPTEDGG